MKHRRTVIQRTDIPEGVVRVAEKRCLPLIHHYGQRITLLDIGTLAASCYLQGVEECCTVHQKMETERTPLDYHI
jgi:hypothetical protein